MEKNAKHVKIKKIVKNTLIVLIAAAVVFGAGYITGRSHTVEPEKAVEVRQEDPGIQLPGETEKTVITVDQVESKILEIGELTSCEGDYTVKRGRDYTRYIFTDVPIPGTTNHVELTCNGIVKAGYKLEEIDVRIDEKNKTIYVRLPEAQINSNQILWDSSMICSENNCVLNPIDFEEYRTLIPEIKAEGLKKAKENGLFETVEKNAEKLIKNFLSCFADYEVTFI